MKITANILLALALFGFSACSDSDSKETTTSNQPVNTANTQRVPATSATPATGVALNPEHGQPGHRCDIEVGAPLSTPVQPKLTTPPPVFQPQPSGSVAAGTNPPHGQPGHDCGIPVGAPLKK
ncbi:hypothetical protein [Pontibacter roseus]|uniref:hypothetical protein n=1 Tax=Pontibacter roseus TaxID=336989 RepID=UPI00036801C3|nr:hypothetical protein [Pontibacter roseus]